MLDFYLIKDAQAQPDDPEQAGLEFAGRLDERTFVHLKKKGIPGIQLDCYSDFRLDTALLNQIRQYVLKKELLADDDISALRPLLDAAELHQTGLIAYGD